MTIGTFVLLALFATAAPTPLPPTAEPLALALLDSEALYTVAGGLKPVSEGFWQTRFPAAQQTSREVEAVRGLLAALPLGPDLEGGVLVFAAPFQGKRSASAFVVHKPRLRELICRRADVFGPLGVTAASWPQEVMEKIDRGPTAARWRAFGLVFGYPEYAVEFFVAAGEREERTGGFVERDFVHLPTFVADRGGFVYAVPKGHAGRAEDRTLRISAGEILDRYVTWRTAYLADGGTGPVALLRDWAAPPAVRCPPRAATPIACEPQRVFVRLYWPQTRVILSCESR